MRAVFRFDASPAIGAGHAYRCATLAQALSSIGWNCHCVVNEEAADTVPTLRQNPGFTLNERREAPQEAADWLIVDHYGLDADWEGRSRGWAKNVLVIDDLADRQHDCDLLLDQTFERKAASYAGLVPGGCRVLTGSQMALLRPAFLQHRKRSLGRRQADPTLKRLLVSFGATDPENHSLTALEAVAESGLPLTVDVVLGRAAPHLAALQEAIEALPLTVKLSIDTPHMAELMATADLAIGAAGTSTWERCCLGLPSLMMAIADNQKEIATAVARSGAAMLLTGSRQELGSQIREALCDFAAWPSGLTAMTAAAVQVCDGRGCDRMSLALTSVGRSKDDQEVTLRIASPEDEDLILTWQSHPTTRRFSRNPAVPTAQEHHDWFNARLNDPDCRLTLICLAGRPAGVLRLDRIDPAVAAQGTPAYEISILVSPEHRGQGVALEALNFARRWHANAVIVAEVLPGNSASASLFAAAGYRAGPDGLLYNPPAESVIALSD